MQFLTPTTLTGHLVSLEPLDDVHIEGLRAAVQDGHINDLWYTLLDVRASGQAALIPLGPTWLTFRVLGG